MNKPDKLRAAAAEARFDASTDAVADEEENMLRYLGAAVITRRSTLPSKVQRELFDDASAIRELADATKADLASLARH